jgi:hypothetical protein
LAAFFAAGFFAALVADFLAAFFVFFATRLPFFAAAFLVARTRGDLRTFFVFLVVFFLAFFATTDSFMTSSAIVGIDIERSVYPTASASIPNTEKTSGFRSRL